MIWLIITIGVLLIGVLVLWRILKVSKRQSLLLNEENDNLSNQIVGLRGAKDEVSGKLVLIQRKLSDERELTKKLTDENAKQNGEITSYHTRLETSKSEIQRLKQLIGQANQTPKSKGAAKRKKK